MSAQEIDHPTPPELPAETATPATEVPSPAVSPARSRRRVRLGILSGLVTGAIVGAGVVLGLLAQPEPRLDPQPARAAAPPAVAVKAPSITVVPAMLGPITQTATITGTLVPREEVLVAPEIDGYAIENIFVEIGDHVEKGQVLARL